MISKCLKLLDDREWTRNCRERARRSNIYWLIAIPQLWAKITNSILFYFSFWIHVLNIQILMTLKRMILTMMHMIVIRITANLARGQHVLPKIWSMMELSILSTRNQLLWSLVERQVWNKIKQLMFNLTQSNIRLLGKWCISVNLLFIWSLKFEQPFTSQYKTYFDRLHVYCSLLFLFTGTGAIEYHISASVEVPNFLSIGFKFYTEPFGPCGGQRWCVLHWLYVTLKRMVRYFEDAVW